MQLVGGRPSTSREGLLDRDLILLFSMPAQHTASHRSHHLSLHSARRVLALLMGAFVGAVFFDVSFDVSGAQNRVGEWAPAVGRSMPAVDVVSNGLTPPNPPPTTSPTGAMFFVLCFFAFTSLTTVDLFQMERKMVVREVRGEHGQLLSRLLAVVVAGSVLVCIRTHRLAGSLACAIPTCVQNMVLPQRLSQLRSLAVHPCLHRRLLPARHLPAGKDGAGRPAAARHPRLHLLCTLLPDGAPAFPFLAPESVVLHATAPA